MDKKIVRTIDEWNDIALELISNTKSDAMHASVVVLTGDLGAGKTTFVQALAKILNVDEPVTSPTFTLLKRYETGHKSFPHLLHMDAYRIESVDELAPLRFDELLNTPQTLFVIEWGERIAEALPEHTLWYVLESNLDGTHTIQSVTKE